jgi:AmiR/NasT family two-component response regulator
VQTTDTPARIQSELSTALQTRDRIGMAKGILMAQRGISERDALRELVARAQESRRTVAEVALDLTAGTPAS